jgi:hypothetical protein
LRQLARGRFCQPEKTVHFRFRGEQGIQLFPQGRLTGASQVEERPPGGGIRQLARRFKQGFFLLPRAHHFKCAFGKRKPTRNQNRRVSSLFTNVAK